MLAPIRRRWRPFVTALVGLALVGTACDDDAGDATGTTSSTTTPVTSTGEPDATPPGTTEASAPTGEPILVYGLLAPDAGLLNTLVVGQQRGLQLALDDINAAGGVLGGPVTSVSAAESADAPLADTVALLAQQGAHVIVGPVGSATAVELLPILDEQQLLACSASATATSLTATGDIAAPPRFVRTALRDDHVAVVVADQLMKPFEGGAPPATVMVVGRDDVFGDELTAGLAAELTARGAATTTLSYPSRRVQFPDEAAAVVASAPDRVVLVSFEEGPRLVADLVTAGYPVDQIVGLDSFLQPAVAEQAFPGDPGRADGLTAIGTTGDRALVNRLRQTSAPQDQLVGGPQMYDCVITVALAAIAAGSTETAAIAAQIGPVTSGGRACSTFAHCAELLAAGEDIDYDGTTGHLAIDDVGDVSTARVTTARVIDGQLQPIAHQDIDLVAQRQDAVFAASVFVTQLQQALRVLGYYDGEVTGIYDDATTAAVGALQTDLGLPATGQYDSATDAALRERIGARLATIGTGIAELQQALADRGYYQGPIDGRFNDATVAAIKAFQTDLGVPPTGIIDVATLRAIYARGVASGELLVPPPPEPTTPPKPPAPTTVPAPTVAPTAPEPPPTAAPATTTAPTPTTDAPSEPADPPDTTEPPVTGPDLYDALSSDARFSTFIELARIAGYDHDLSQLGPFTVFAPTDDAFEALDPDELEELRTDPAAANALLRDLIVEDRIAGVDLRSGPLRTIGGGSIEIATGAGGTTAGGAQVSADAIEASNGVVHALATVPTSG